MKVSVIGNGKQSQRVFNTLSSMGVSIVSPLESEWVYIASSNLFHYEQAETYLSQSKKVIIEKPPTLNPKAYQTLINRYGATNICSVDVFTRHDLNISKNEFIWHKDTVDYNNTSLLYRLMYHHIQLIVHYGLDYTKFVFDYRIGKNKHILFGKEFKPKGNPLKDMLIEIFTGQFDYAYNHKLTIKTLEILQQIKRLYEPKIAVVGGGIFGCTTAMYLSNAGFNVDLYERNSELLSETSSINQYRIHMGYHYPRSPETITQCVRDYVLFEKFYADAVIKSNNCYSISTKNSKTSAKTFLSVLDEYNLSYDLLSTNINCDLTIQTPENVYSPTVLKLLIEKRLYSTDVNVMLNKTYTNELDDKYDRIINGTYANTNKLSILEYDLQFEICEKPIVKLPEQYRGKSHVIMDGPFMCIDPYDNTDYHVMGNVVHAIHHSNIGQIPDIPEQFLPLLNKGVIKNPKITNIHKFIESAKMYFPDIDQLEHIGSMFTIRTVIANRDYDDARTSAVYIKDKYFNILSGKMCSSVNIAKQIVQNNLVKKHLNYKHIINKKKEV